jgi:hypothetical protein
MIKHINHQNFLTTPFVAAKSWHLYNRDPDDLVILEPTGSEDTVALEYTDYSTDNPFVNTDCSIALEQQSSDFINYQEAATGSGKFYPDREATNNDGTFKRLVHAQTKAAFYNKYNDPTKIFGVEFIDFPLGQTFRDLSNIARLFNVPQHVFGERIIENTVRLNDAAMDDNVEVTDDGHQNLVARSNLFSKVQEVRPFGNIIMSGTSSYVCYDTYVRVYVADSGSTLTIGGFISGEQLDVPTIEADNFAVGFYTGSLTLEIISSSAADTSSVDVGFYTGSLGTNVITTSGSADSSSMETSFYTGSLYDQVLLRSGSFESQSMATTFYTGSLFNEVVTSSLSMSAAQQTASFNVGFLSGVLS